jgi:hypothetical protein
MAVANLVTGPHPFARHIWLTRLTDFFSCNVTSLSPSKRSMARYPYPSSSARGY